MSPKQGQVGAVAHCRALFSAGTSRDLTGAGSPKDGVQGGLRQSSLLPSFGGEKMGWEAIGIILQGAGLRVAKCQGFLKTALGTLGLVSI